MLKVLTKKFPTKKVQVEISVTQLLNNKWIVDAYIWQKSFISYLGLSSITNLIELDPHE